MADVYPLARQDGIITETVDDELLVYDERRDTAHRLNRTAATVWRHCDGRRTAGDLVGVLAAEIGDVADEDLVMVTLDDLAESDLLQGHARREREATRLSRRRFIRRVGVVGTAALVLPVVHSIVAPTPSAAQTGSCICSCSCYCYCYCKTCSCSCSCSFTTCVASSAR